MKKCIFVFLWLSVKICISYSQENFFYSAGDTLRNYWYYIGPMGNDYYIRITSEGLSFPNYAGSELGNAALLDTMGPEILWQFIEFTGFESGNVFTSFMVSVNAAKPGGANFADIGNSVRIASRYFTTGGVYAKDSLGKLAFGISKHYSSPPVYTPAVYFRDTTYLIVMKYSFMPGINNDSLSLFVFSESLPTYEPIPLIKANPSYPDLPDVGSFMLIMRDVNSSKLIVDGIYMMNFWDNGILPVELTEFTGFTDKSDIVLHWSTASEHNNAGFEVQKLSGNNEWIPSGYVKGNGTVNAISNYFFTEKNLKAGVYKYRLKQIDINGSYRFYYSGEDITVSPPSGYALNQNYPNPFNSQTKISFEIPVPGFTKLILYDTEGKTVMNLLNEYRDAGYHELTFRGDELSSGVYFYGIESGGFKYVKKLVVIK